MQIICIFPKSLQNWCENTFTVLRGLWLWFSWLGFVQEPHIPWWQTLGFLLVVSLLGVSHQVWWKGRKSAGALELGKRLVEAQCIPPFPPQFPHFYFFSGSNRKSIDKISHLFLNSKDLPSSWRHCLFNSNISGWRKSTSTLPNSYCLPTNFS